MSQIDESYHTLLISLIQPVRVCIEIVAKIQELLFACLKGIKVAFHHDVEFMNSSANRISNLLQFKSKSKSDYPSLQKKLWKIFVVKSSDVNIRSSKPEEK